jgi:acetoin utilization deacetylase AcuC-like enzyme
LKSRLKIEDADLKCFYASMHMNSVFPTSAIKLEKSGSCKCVGGSLDCSGATWLHQHMHGLKVDDFEGKFVETFGAFASKLVEFKPDILFFSAGFDAHREEGMVGGKTQGKGVTGADYKTITTAILRAIGPGVPVVSVLEGGYAKEAIMDGLKGHLEGLKSA